MAPTNKISVMQQKLMADFMAANLDFAHNRLVGEAGAGSFAASVHKWEELSVLLNSVGDGTTKDVTGWRNYWKSWKNKIKQKASARRLEARRTGGGPNILKPLSEIELVVLGVIGERAVTGYPEVSVPFSFTSTIEATPSTSQWQMGSTVCPVENIASSQLQMVRSPSPPPSQVVQAQTPSPRRRVRGGIPQQTPTRRRRIARPRRDVIDRPLERWLRETENRRVEFQEQTVRLLEQLLELTRQFVEHYKSKG